MNKKIKSQIFGRIVSARVRMIVRNSGMAGLLMAFLMGLTGCFTGIESTKKIKLTKSEEKELAPTAEETFLADVVPTAHTEWVAGKTFIVVSDRGNVLFEPQKILSGRFALTAGDTLRFRNAGVKRLPDGNSVTCVEFSRGDDTFLYIPQGGSAAVNAEVMSDAIPGVVDPDIISKISNKISGCRLWTLTPVWSDEAGNRMDGRRFEAVTIETVTPGDMVFPIKVGFRDSSGRHAVMLMSIGKNYGGDSRAFSSLFSLSDPKLTYPNISDKIWKAIMEGRVELGMTRDECRLAKGNPVDVLDGRDYSHTQVVWTYGDGTVLHFVDGVLRGINRLAKDY
ncbi:MAG: hypothetical protein K2H35_06855 [Muribaculaceae bacterium]|nr:hypothetical protein [Muribaculaceae bacterium]